MQQVYNRQAAAGCGPGVGAVNLCTQNAKTLKKFDDATTRFSSVTIPASAALPLLQ
jgi:hypothetical protein